MFDQGQLEKMTITAYEDPGRGSTAKPTLSPDPAHTYTVQVNPSSYTESRRIRHAERCGQGASGQEATYSGTDPRTMEFEFLFDGSGVVPPPSVLSDVPLVGAIASALPGAEGPYNVTDELAKFDKVMNYDGTVHRPRRLHLSWGRLKFDCVLTSLSIRFTLFNPDGSPLRAIASCSFRESMSCAERELRERKSSPDLTHVREIKAGDSLPLMAKEIYGDPGLYLEVARVNKIVNFRRLSTGRRIELPPIDKGSKR
jgi:hypothetical protein